MTFYDFMSTILTVVGYSVLVYRTIFELESGKMKKNRQEKLCTKWLIFTIFLKLEYYMLAIVEIIPFGTLFMLIFKMFLFLPENAVRLFRVRSPTKSTNASRNIWSTTPTSASPSPSSAPTPWPSS
jgi:hypothetical protein